MEREKIAQSVIAVTARELNKNTDQIKEEHHFAYDLGADSLKSIELVAAFEEEFDLDLDEEQALKVQTVGGAIDFFSKLLPD
ncbi:acyl carrier protein [candidate division KSB1 bacterium]|nr:acyl carrier protein [candidate division KSB1 bacterium]